MATGGSLIGALRVTLGLDSSQFEAGTKRARAVAQRDVSAIQKTLKGVTTAFKGFLAITAATGLVSAAKRALDYASSLAEVSQQLGVTTRDLQVYRYVATQVGIEQDEMDKGLQKLTKSIGEAAEGAKKPAAAFRELGVAVKDSKGELYTAGEIIPRLADALSKIEAPAKRARLETALFGKTGQQLDTLLTEGAKGIQAYADEAEKLGLIMGDDLIQKADAAADRLSVLSKVLEVELASTVADNAEGILIFANAFLALVSGIGDAITWLRKFGHEARQAVNVAQGWTPFGGRSSGESGYRARARYFSEGVAWDEEERRRNEVGSTARNAKLRPPGDLPTPSGGGGRKRNPPKDRTAEYEARFLDQLTRARTDNLEAYADLTGSVEEEYKARLASLAADRASFDREIALDEHLDATKREQLTAERDRHDEIQKQLIEERLTADQDRRTYDLKRADLDAMEEVARYHLDLARTASERREIELGILDLKKREEKAQLELTLATEKTGTAAYTRAWDQMQSLDDRYRRQEDLIHRDTMGPMESYLDSIPKTVDEINEAFENVAADGLKSLNDGIADAIMGSKSLGDAFKSVANQIIADLIRIAVQKAVTNAIGGVMKGFGTGGSTGGGGFGGEFFASNSAVSGAYGLGGGGGDTSSMSHEVPGHAGGGSFMVGGRPGVDRNVISVNGIPRARVSHNENVKIGHGAGGPPVVFDMRGAVVTEDLLQQMNVIASERSATVVGKFAQGQARSVRQNAGMAGRR